MHDRIVHVPYYPRMAYGMPGLPQGELNPA
jgi:hypothetical protein